MRPALTPSSLAVALFAVTMTAFVQSSPQRPASVAVDLYPKQLIHVKLPEALTVPPRGSGAAMATGEATMRARLTNPLIGNAAGLGMGVMVPADVAVNMAIRLSPRDPQGTDSRLTIQIMSANVDPAVGRQQLISGTITHDFAGWPTEKSVLLPANTPLSFTVSAGAGRTMPREEFASGTPASILANDYGSRPILQGSRLEVTLLEDIDVTQIGKGKLFRAQLNADMELPRLFQDVGALKLSRGTEVFVKAVDSNPRMELGRVAGMSVDSVTIKGHRVPLKTVAWTSPFSPTTVIPGGRNGRDRVPMVLWPSGMSRWIDVAEQMEVADDGTPILLGPPEPAGGPITTLPVQQTQPQRAAPAPTTPAPRGAPAGQPTVEELQQRGQRVLACQQQAIKDHPRGGADLTEALKNCQTK